MSFAMSAPPPAPAAAAARNTGPPKSIPTSIPQIEPVSALRPGVGSMVWWMRTLPVSSFITTTASDMAISPSCWRWTRASSTSSARVTLSNETPTMWSTSPSTGVDSSAEMASVAGRSLIASSLPTADDQPLRSRCSW